MSKGYSNTDLIELAKEVMNPKHLGDCYVGQVGSALELIKEQSTGVSALIRDRDLVSALSELLSRK